MGLLSGTILPRHLKYALLVQFYVILALVYCNIIPDSYPILAESGFFFVCGVFLLVYRGLSTLLRQNRVLTWAVAGFVVALTVYMYFKNATYTTYFFDLGNFEQPLYTTLFGHQFFSLNASPNVVQEVAYHVYIPTPNTTFFFTAEFSPMLLLLLPFYAIYPSPITLALLQNLALALPALLIYRLVESQSRRLWVSLLYLGYAPLYFAAIWDFHTEAFFPLFLFLAMYFLKSDLKWFLVSSLLFLSVNQAGPVLLVFMLPYVYQRTKNAALVSCLAILAVVFVGANYAVSGYFLDSRLAVPSGGGIGSAVLSGLGGKLTYVILVLAPLLFIPVLSPLVALPAGAWLAYAFVSGAPPFTSMLYQYSMIPAGFLFLGVVAASGRINPRLLKVGLVVSLCVFAVSWPWSGNAQAGTSLPYSNPAYPKLDYYLQQIPPYATVLASNSVFPHLANRLGTYFDPNFPPQWIILDKNDGNLVFQQPYVNHYLQVAPYTILENDSLLFVARLNA